MGRSWRWLEPLARRFAATFAHGTRPRHRDVVQFLLDDPDFQEVWSRKGRAIWVDHWLAEPQRMQPVAAGATWNVHAIESVGALSDWLQLTPGELDWFADLKGFEYKRSNRALRNYHYRVLAKGYGSVRLIEAPKPRLKELQRQVLTRILERIPPHSAAHGFVKGRSIKTFAAPHVGRRVVLRMDLSDFFPSIAAVRVQSLFRTAGYPEAVADLLGGLCTNAAPRDIWHTPVPDVSRTQLREVRDLYARPHLPQGAPTSPALANLCAYRADCRLASLARSIGADYTRYADDLAFSGNEELERRAERVAMHVAAILHEEGFAVHHRKTRIMRQGVRQYLAGLVTNQHVNVVRADFDLLKATLTNCVRLGPSSQNRGGHADFRSHLEGRVGFVEQINPAKGERLRSIFEQIRW